MCNISFVMLSPRTILHGILTAKVTEGASHTQAHTIHVFQLGRFGNQHCISSRLPYCWHLVSQAFDEVAKEDKVVHWRSAI